MQDSTLNSYNNRISTRDSNIELVRIVAMLFVIFGHLSRHGGLFEHSGNILNLLWGGVLLPGGKIGYDCFIIITAWFCIEKDFKGSRYLRIALEAVFYNLLGMILTVVLNNGVAEPVNIRNFIGCVFPIFGNSHGFAVYYMIFLLMLPLLNNCVRKMSKRNILSIIVLLFMMQIGSRVFAVIIDYEPFVDLSSGLATFFILYFAVAYIKRWPLIIVEKKSVIVFTFIAIWIINATVNILAEIYPDARLFSLMLQVITPDESPSNMVAGFCLFFLFKGLNMKHSNVINFIASHTFGVLLLHDHNYFRYVIWKRVFFVESFFDAGLPLTIAYSAIVVLTVFAAGIIIDTIREYVLEKPIVKTKIYSKICSGLESCFRI